MAENTSSSRHSRKVAQLPVHRKSKSSIKQKHANDIVTCSAGGVESIASSFGLVAPGLRMRRSDEGILTKVMNVAQHLPIMQSVRQVNDRVA